MRKSNIIKSAEGNFFLKKKGIPKGCKYCLKGVKAVLFLNGICQKPNHCSWYCPISEKRRDKDISYIDEIRIFSKEDIIDELTKINAKGISLTGGEPLTKENFNKTLDYIKFLKKIMGNKFHIHLYTNGLNFSDLIANELINAGLDEIRFHPPKDKWKNIKYAMNKGISVGAEVPIIPNDAYVNDLKQFILYLDSIGADFINLNEFEYCFPNSQSLQERGYELKENTIASVKNSKENALEIMKEMGPKINSLNIHFCSIRAKDYYQLKNRYLQRAKNIRKPYETITEEGLLLYGLIEGNDENLKKIYEILIHKSRLSKKLIQFNKTSIELPYYILIEDSILDLIEKLILQPYILETLPFQRKEYKQITEKIPARIFKYELK